MFNKVKIDKIYPARAGKNPDYSTLQVRAEEMQKNLTSTLLDGQAFDKKRVAFHTVKNTVIEKYGLKEGDDLSAKLGMPMRIAVEENFTGGQGFQIKINPATKQELSSGGRQIWRKTYLAEASAQDKEIKHDNVTVPAQAVELAA